MIPILFETTESTFTTNGIGRMADAISCVVSEERNGPFELTLVYPMTGIHYGELTEDRILFVSPRPGASGQAFRIYKISKPLNGRVTVYARHISYQLNKIVVMPFTAGTCTAAFANMATYAVGECPFTFWTDKQVTANFSVTIPSTIRSVLGGQQGSILDAFGTGEYEWDNWTVKFHLHRGNDNGVTIRYGKNLTDLKNDTNIENVYTAIVPYFANENTVVTLPERVMYGEHIHDYTNIMAVPVDFSNQFQNEVPTEAQLRTAAQRYLNQSENWKISQNITVSFVSLADTEEYKDIAALQRVNLCDTVTIIHPKLGVEAHAKVVKVKYDALNERYNELTLGDTKTNLSQAIVEASGIMETVPTKTALQQAIEHATQLITGGLGGHIVINRNADGEPEEILIMDTDDIETAVNVWRWNLGGLGHSSNGYNGPFDDVAITQDGSINATMITSGNMNAQYLTAGVIRDKAGSNWWNLDTGEMNISAESFIDTSDFVTQAQFTAAADQIATEVVAQVGSGIFFNCTPIDNGNGTTTILAHVYLNRNDATESFAPQFFRWYKKTEDGKEYLGYGYEITVTNSEYGYGGEVECTFLMLEDRHPVNSQGRWIFTMEGSYYTLAASQGSLKFQQGYPMVLSESTGSADVYPVFGYDYY